MNIYQKFLTSVLLFLVLTSCQEKKEAVQAKKEIVQLDSLEIFNTNLTVQGNSKYYIVTYLNSACPTCVSEIEKWNEIYKEVKNRSCGLRIVCYADDYFEYFKYQCSKGRIKSDVEFYLDTTSRFSKRNEMLFTGSADKTGLIDSDNNLLAVGNPVHSKQVLEKYLKIIN